MLSRELERKLPLENLLRPREGALEASEHAQRAQCARWGPGTLPRVVLVYLPGTLPREKSYP